jgi:hypothetical protein
MLNPFPVYKLSFKNTKGDYEASKQFFEKIFNYPETSGMVKYNDEMQTIEIYCFPRQFYALMKKSAELDSKFFKIFPSWDNKNLKDPYQVKNINAMFDANFMTAEYKELEIKQFNAAASYFEKKYSKIEYSEFNFESFNPNVSQDKHSYSLVFNELAKSSFGLGESHHHFAPKKLLVQNLRLLKDAGIDTIFVEGIYYEYQSLIDNYLSDP